MDEDVAESELSGGSGELQIGYIHICAGPLVERCEIIKRKAIADYGEAGIMLGIRLLQPCTPGELMRANTAYQIARGLRPHSKSEPDSDPVGIFVKSKSALDQSNGGRNNFRSVADGDGFEPRGENAVAKFVVRVALLGETAELLEKLHAVMTAEGFVRYTLDTATNLKYYLPPGEYKLEGIFDITQVFTKAERAVKSLGQKYVLTATEVKSRMWSGLEPMDDA